MRKIRTNWILEYSERMNQISEAPSAYNIWSAISLIGGVLKNHVWVDRGTYIIYPNQYIVLVGPPGVGKGSAMHPAHTFSKKATPPLCNYMNDRLTAPKIIERLATGIPSLKLGSNGVMSQSIDSSAMLYSTELSAFLGGSDWMIPFLCAAWDQGEYEYDTKHSGTNIVKNMCVSLMAGCVPDFIRNLNKSGQRETAISGGFTARAIFVFASDKAQSIVWPESFASGKGKQLYDDLKHDIEQIGTLSGEFTWEPAARFTFERFYRDIKIEDDDTDVLRNFKARQNIHVLKVAMCLSAAKREDLVLDQYCIDTAIRLVDSVLKTLNITFRGVGESSLAEATGKIMSYIEKKGVCSRKSLITDNWRFVTTEDLDRIIITLKLMGFLEEVNVGQQVGYKHLLGAVRVGTTNGKIII